jgi:hypothetical protein
MYSTTVIVILEASKLVSVYSREIFSTSSLLGYCLTPTLLTILNICCQCLLAISLLSAVCRIRFIYVAISLYSIVTTGHRWASTSILMSAISDIRHRHLLLRYRRQICRTENCHSDIRSVLISTSESIPISDIYKQNVT